MFLWSDDSQKRFFERATRRFGQANASFSWQMLAKGSARRSNNSQELRTIGEENDQ